MVLTDDINRTERVLSNLPTHWSKDEKSFNYKLFNAFAEELKTANIKIDSMKSAVFIDTAAGEQLNDLGKLFKLGRDSGETDEQYRARIKGYWPGFSGAGTADSLKRTLNAILNIPTENITITDINFVKFLIQAAMTSEQYETLKETIESLVWKIKAAGVYPFFQWAISDLLTTETLVVDDSNLTITSYEENSWFIIESSLIEGQALLP